MMIGSIVMMIFGSGGIIFVLDALLDQLECYLTERTVMTCSTCSYTDDPSPFHSRCIKCMQDKVLKMFTNFFHHSAPPISYWKTAYVLLHQNPTIPTAD